MKTYKVKIEAEIEVQAFSEEDAMDYINDIMGIDEEVKKVTIKKVEEK